MRVLVASRQDVASTNIRDRLLESGLWTKASGAFRGAPVWQRGEARLVEIEGPSVHDEALEGDVRATGWPVAAVWFLSRHRAESGHPSLTVHPMGNHGSKADLGGRPSMLSTAAPRDMGALLRRLKARRDEAALPHSVTFEATHHGPFLSYPSLFVELGSDETWYRDAPSARVLAAAIHDVLDGGGARDGPVLVSVGGGHYVPRATDVALAGTADFGHFIPAYALEGAESDVLERAVAATPHCSAIHMHRKGLRGPERQRVIGWLAELGLPSWSEES